MEVEQKMQKMDDQEDETKRHKFRWGEAVFKNETGSEYEIGIGKGYSFSFKRERRWKTKVI